MTSQLREILLSLGLDPDAPPDPHEDITTTPRTLWESGTKLTPPTPIYRYLEAGDTLTDFAIDQMERYIETWAGVESPWCVTSLRSGSEREGTLQVEYFYLLNEDGDSD